MDAVRGKQERRRTPEFASRSTREVLGSVFYRIVAAARSVAPCWVTPWGGGRRHVRLPWRSCFHGFCSWCRPPGVALRRWATVRPCRGCGYTKKADGRVIRASVLALMPGSPTNAQPVRVGGVPALPVWVRALPVRLALLPSHAHPAHHLVHWGLLPSRGERQQQCGGSESCRTGRVSLPFIAGADRSVGPSSSSSC